MTLAQIIGELVLGWLLADLLAGAFHWWEDRCARVDTPIIGRWIIAPNRLHHVEPLAFTQGGLISRNLATWTAALIVSAAWLAAAGPSLTWATATVGGLVVNEVHRLAHVPMAAPAPLRVLQEIGLIQSPRHHAGHHRQPDGRYCVLTDWLNPILDNLQVWGRIERLLDRVGLTPNRGSR